MWNLQIITQSTPIGLRQSTLQNRIMKTPDIETSTREERLEFIRDEFKCLGNCPICGKCSFLRGREAEELYADYIDGKRSFRDITAEHRNC